jgi:hypothetical protein
MAKNDGFYLPPLSSVLKNFEQHEYYPFINPGGGGGYHGKPHGGCGGLTISVNQVRRSVFPWVQCPTLYILDGGAKSISLSAFQRF